MADGMGIFDRTVGLLNRSLDLRQQNQKVIASNIANAETPGYAPARLEFQESLRRALSSGEAVVRTHRAHFPLQGQGGIQEAQGRIVSERNPLAVGDRNTVQVDQEMIALAENQILYEASVQMLNRKLGMLKYAATDGGK